jgi:nucleoside-diphosphate-sugar epimerase
MSKSLIFITGGTGFIGAEVIHQALEAGYRVRLSVRKPEQEIIVKERYPKHASDIETVIISDITKRGSFETALNDVDYVIHLASPLAGKGMDLKKDFIEPAVGGTAAILYAALKFPNIKTVVVTSSAIGIMPIDAPLILDHTIKGKFALYAFSVRTDEL